MWQIIGCKYDYSDIGGYNCINLMCNPHIPLERGIGFDEYGKSADEDKEM